jgi:hypothetical protein
LCGFLILNSSVFPGNITSNCQPQCLLTHWFAKFID